MALSHLFSCQRRVRGKMLLFATCLTMPPPVALWDPEYQQKTIYDGTFIFFTSGNFLFLEPAGLSLYLDLDPQPRASASNSFFDLELKPRASSLDLDQTLSLSIDSRPRASDSSLDLQL